MEVSMKVERKKFVGNPLYELLREHNQGKLIRDCVFYSFSSSTIYGIARHLVDLSVNSIHYPFRLISGTVGEIDTQFVLYDTISQPPIPLRPLRDFSFATVDYSLEETNDKLRRYGFSTVDHPFYTLDRIHYLRSLLCGLPAYHSTWMRNGDRYVLFQNGVVVRPLL